MRSTPKPNIEFLFDFVTPTSYLAYRQINRLEAYCNIEVKRVPIFLGGVFKLTGNSSPTTVPAKSRYVRRDLERWASKLDVPLKWNPNFPFDTLHLMRIATYAKSIDRLDDLCDAVFDALWVEALHIRLDDTLDFVMENAGLDPISARAAAHNEPIKSILKQQTEAAVARGVFGAPSFFVDDVLFFGQDRMQFIAAEVLSGGIAV